MADVHDVATRSRNMAAIRAVDTKPELFVRRALHGLRLRYRLHVRSLPGTPDLVFPRHRAVVFVHGCFWHKHDCHFFKWPKNRAEFWRAKIERNVANDADARLKLREKGWRIAEVWECAFTGKTRIDGQEAMQSLATWVRSGGATMVIRGNEDWSHLSGN